MRALTPRRLSLLLVVAASTLGCPKLGDVPIRCVYDLQCPQDWACAADGFCAEGLTPLSIGGLEPAAVLVGAPTTMVTLTGTRFGPTTQVQFDGAEVPTTYLGPTQLSISVDASSMATARVILIRVRDGVASSEPAIFAVNNPIPTLTAVSPASVLADSTQTLTVTGSGFIRGAVIIVNDQELSTAFVSETELSAPLPPGIASVSGQRQVTVRNPQPTAGPSSPLYFNVEAVIRTVVGRAVEGMNPLRVPLAGAVHTAVHPSSGEIHFSEAAKNRIVKVGKDGKLHVVAGTGVPGSSGDGSAATAARISEPGGLGFGADGTLYFADRGNQRIRAISPEGTISTVAGDGWCDNTNDYGAASAARVGDVTDLVVGPSGAIYFTTCGCNGHRVRRISGGTISTVVGNGAATSTGDGSYATAASINCPRALAVDASERLFVAEGDGNRVRLVEGGNISTYAGTGAATSAGDGGPATSAGLLKPWGVAVAANGDVFVSQYDDAVIRKVSATTRTISTFAGNRGLHPLSPDGAPAAGGSIGHPTDLLFKDGDLHFATEKHAWTDYGGIKRVNADGTLSSVAGGLPDDGPNGTDTILTRPEGVTVDDAGNLYVVDTGNDRILRLDSAGRLTRVVGTGTRDVKDSGPGPSTEVWSPSRAWHDGANLYFTQFDRVSRLDPSGPVSTVAGGASWPSGCPTGSPTSTPAGAGPGYDCLGNDYLATSARVLIPSSVVGDRAGNLYFAEGRWLDGTGNRIRHVDLSTGKIFALAGSTAASGETCGNTGDGGPANLAKLCDPQAIVRMPSGDLLVADSGNRRLRRINLASAPRGQISAYAFTGANSSSGDGGPASAASICRPEALAYDGAGNLYVGDVECHTIRKIDPAGIVTTVAGTSSQRGFSGDLGRPQQALFNGVFGLAFGGNPGALYIADGYNDRIRKIGP